VLRNIKLRAAFITSAIIMLVSSCLLLVGSWKYRRQKEISPLRVTENNFVKL
jgi:hypothetical protein